MQDQQPNFVLQVDTREHQSEMNRRISYCLSKGIKVVRSKLLVGDYMNIRNPNLAIDTKQNILEIINNVTKSHERFRNEVQLAKDIGVQLVVLIEGCNWKSINSLNYWKPRMIMYGKRKGQLESQMKGETLAKILWTMHNKYGVIFMFCKKEDSSRLIYEMLSGKVKPQQF